jgi:class 3 adenylate cyclase
VSRANGIHTGEPSLGDERYHGLGVHRAARIMAAGHGGQVLLSQATCSVLEDDELPGIGLRDLGQHRMGRRQCDPNVNDTRVRGRIPDAG